jgi:pimeloyl-ACP methyl ester carboxylesterase
LILLIAIVTFGINKPENFIPIKEPMSTLQALHNFRQIFRVLRTTTSLFLSVLLFAGLIESAYGAECYEWQFSGGYTERYFDHGFAHDLCSVLPPNYFFDSGQGSTGYVGTGMASDKIIECGGSFIPQASLTTYNYSDEYASGSSTTAVTLTTDGKLSQEVFAVHAEVSAIIDCEGTGSVPFMTNHFSDGKIIIDLRDLTISGEYYFHSTSGSARSSGRSIRDAIYISVDPPLEAWKTPIPQLSIYTQLENPLANNAFVSRMAADGETKVTLVIRSSTADAVTLATTTPSHPDRRSQIPLVDGPVALQPSSNPLYPFEARMDMVVPRQAWNDFKPLEVQVIATQGEHSHQLGFQVQSPPVVAIHGLWSSPEAWGKLHEITQYLPVADISFVDYERFNHHDFSRREVQDFARAQLRSRRKELMEGGLAFTRFDVVAHSMGALLARTLPGHPWYKREDNGNLGELGFLVSIGSPMLGSPLAQILADNAQDVYVPCTGSCGTQFELMCAQLGDCEAIPTVLAHALSAFGMPITCGLPANEACAVQALTPGSAQLNALASPAELPYVGVRGVAPEDSPEETMLNALLLPLSLSTLDSLFLQGPNGHAKHDTIVGYLSQNAGASQQTDIENIFHASVPNLIRQSSTETNSSEVMRAVACYLGGLSACAPAGIEGVTATDVPEAYNQAILDAFLATDISDWQDVSADGLVVGYAEGFEPVMGSPTSLDVSAVEGQVEVVFYQVGNDALQKVVGNPAYIPVTPRTPTISIHGVALLSDNRFARFRHDAEVTLPGGPPYDLLVTPRNIRMEQGTSLPLQVKARYVGGLFDVTGLVTSEWEGGEALATLDDGILQALAAGSGAIRISWSGAQAVVPVQVEDVSVIFHDGFEPNP